MKTVFSFVIGLIIGAGVVVEARGIPMDLATCQREVKRLNAVINCIYILDNGGRC